MRRLTSVFLLSILLFTGGCGGGADDATDSLDRTAEDDRSGDRLSDPADGRDADRSAGSDPISDIAGALDQALGGDGRSVESVDFRVLRDFLPAELDDMERVDASGERTGVAGFSFSQAEGEYRSDDGERQISLQIVDGGGIAQMAMLGAAWMQTEFDRENSEGYERTTEFEGYPAFEKVRSGARPRSELQFIVAERFLVSANGQNVAMDDLKDAVEEIDLNDLEDLKDEGVER